MGDQLMVEASGLEKSYGSVRVLSGVDLQVDPVKDAQRPVGLLEAGGLDGECFLHLRSFCVRYTLNCVRYTQS